MKRDVDLVREILRCIEGHSWPREEFRVDIKGRTQAEISYHIKLLADAGWVEAMEQDFDGDVRCLPIRLMWKGHEFLEITRDDRLWKKVKETVLSKTGGLSVVAIEALLLKILEAAPPSHSN